MCFTLLANPASLTLKGGVDMVDMGTLIGVWYAWLGTPSSVVLILCVAFAVIGAKEVWHQLPEARTATLGIGMTLLALVATRPSRVALPPKNGP